MKRILLLLSVAVMLFSFQDMHSQKLRERLKKVVFNEEKETPAEEESNTEAEEEESLESTKANFTNKVMMNAMGLSGNVDYEEEYNFDAYIQMEITTYKKNGNLDGQMVYDNYLHKEDADYAMVFSDKDAKSTIIFDTKNSAMLILTNSDGEKTGFATTIDPETMAELAEETAEEEEEVDMDSYKPMKTGKTKQILGYSCDEYLVQDDETEVHMWVSEKLGKEMRKEWMSNNQTFGAMFSHAYAMNGMVLEYDVVDKDGGKSVMQVQKIDMNHSHKVSTTGYNVMSMKQQSGEE